MSIESNASCSLTRRELLRRSCMGFAMLGLTGVMADGGRLVAGDATTGDADAGYKNPLASRLPHFAAKAKRVIHLFMNGGPSHIDTFDPKPALDKFAHKPLAGLPGESSFGVALPSPFKFKKHGHSGIEVSELFPHVAGCVDDLC